MTYPGDDGGDDEERDDGVRTAAADNSCLPRLDEDGADRTTRTMTTAAEEGLSVQDRRSGVRIWIQARENNSSADGHLAGRRRPSEVDFWTAPGWRSEGIQQTCLPLWIQDSLDDGDTRTAEELPMDNLGLMLMKDRSGRKKEMNA